MKNSPHASPLREVRCPPGGRFSSWGGPAMKKTIWTLALAAGFAGTALAQMPASQPMTFVVPYPPGGVSDIMARALAPAMGKVLGRTIVADNLPGASGSIAAKKVLDAPANGNLLFMGSPTEAVLAPATLKAVKYQPMDFRLLAVVYQAPLALYVRGDLPAHSVDELLAYARKPDTKPLSYGSTGPGSLFHLAGEGLREASGLDLAHIAYRGGAPLMQDVMGGNVDMTLLPADGNIAKRVEGGRMRAIAIAAPARVAAFPNVPTFAESKSLPRFTAQGVWAGVMVPAATPEPVVVQLHKALGEALAMPDVRQALEAAGGTSLPAFQTLDQAKAFYQGEIGKLTAAAKLAKLEPN